ncbi:hypothetical protein DPMN_095092 [Dreissena polymorpha]|uniref:Uncharacterized protein n=1 Tax=Dreissena polymorpha TaxID=45954 RepID=A0A9D4L6X5_DREPO|nr:hypothetical protein DPMN_095092 [Dreissena polymorpha]
MNDERLRDISFTIKQINIIASYIFLPLSCYRHDHRDFHVSPTHSSGGDCNRDLLFAAVITTSGYCGYDRPSAYPQVYFATGDHEGKPQTMTGKRLTLKVN